MAIKQYLGNFAMWFLPPTRAFAIKRGLLRWMGADVGQSVRIAHGLRYMGQLHLCIGDDAFLGHELLICGGVSEVNIGERVDIGPRVTVVTGSHEINVEGDRAAGTGVSNDVNIEDGVWVGAGSTILGGVTIGKNAVIAAGSVVTRDIPARSVAAGAPCRTRKTWDASRSQWDCPEPREAA